MNNPLNPRDNFSKEFVAEIFKFYLEKHPNEKLAAQIENLLASGDLPVSRKNFFGHITTSAIVLNPTCLKLLLVHHKALNKTLQPGGHIENTDTSFHQAAQRELVEETSLWNAIYVPFDEGGTEIPIDVDIHQIPENPHKGEPAHYHFDLRYVFILPAHEEAQNANNNEVDHITWVPLTAVATINPDLARVARKTQSFVSQKEIPYSFVGLSRRSARRRRDAKILTLS